MKLKLSFLSLIAGIWSGSAFASEAVAWQLDYLSALAAAKQEKKQVLLDFTGSDWCVWCHRLEDEVFEKPEFLAYAKDNLVLVRLDFPRQKPQPPHLRQQNAKLAETFQVTGYPTVVLVDSDGNEVARTGYMYGGAKTFVRFLRKANHAVISAPAP